MTPELEAVREAAGIIALLLICACCPWVANERRKTRARKARRAAR